MWLAATATRTIEGQYLGVATNTFSSFDTMLRWLAIQRDRFRGNSAGLH